MLIIHLLTESSCNFMQQHQYEGSIVFWFLFNPETSFMWVFTAYEGSSQASLSSFPRRSPTLSVFCTNRKKNENRNDPMWL